MLFLQIKLGGWESRGIPKRGSGEQRRRFLFISQLVVTEELPFGEVMVGNLLIKRAQLGSPSWKSFGSKGGFLL